MKFSKILLASAVAMSSSAFAMQSMDDESLSAATGQDGLRIGITNTGLSAFDIMLHDLDGFTGRTAAGAIILDDVSTTALTGLTIDIDAGSSAISSTDPTLQVRVYNTSPITVNLGTLRVGNSNRDNAGAWGATSISGALANLGSLTIGATDATTPLLNMQMGTEPQGAWIRLTPTFTGGINLTDFALLDAGGTFTGGGIGAVTTSLVDNGGANLSAAVNVDAVAAGLRVELASFGHATNGVDVRLVDVKLGDQALAASIIGDVEVIGLRLANTVVMVSGK